MKRKYKLTGCARFLIFLIIAVPVIYVSATLITGTSPWEELKSLFTPEEEKTELIDNLSSEEGATKEETNLDQESGAFVPSTAKSTDSEQQQVEDLLKRIESLEKKMKELENQLNE